MIAVLRGAAVARAYMSKEGMEVNNCMLLAEALNERADAQRRLLDLRDRIRANARVQEGEQPAEDPQVLLDQAIDVSERIRVLVVAVNVTNTATRLPDGTTVTAALARRDALGRRIRVVTEAAKRAGDNVARWGRAEIREVAVLDVATLRAEADRLAAERIALDAELQRINWTTELAVDI